MGKHHPFGIWANAEHGMGPLTWHQRPISEMPPFFQNLVKGHLKTGQKLIDWFSDQDVDLFVLEPDGKYTVHRTTNIESIFDRLYPTLSDNIWGPQFPTNEIRWEVVTNPAQIPFREWKMLMLGKQAKPRLFQSHQGKQYWISKDVGFPKDDPTFMSFVRALQDNPNDKFGYLVVADWLEENGYIEQSIFLRQSVHRIKNRGGNFQALLDNIVKQTDIYKA